MQAPNHTEAGMLAFAIVSALLDRLVATGALDQQDELAIITSAAHSFNHMHTGAADTCAAFLAEAVRAHPLSRPLPSHQPPAEGRG